MDKFTEEFNAITVGFNSHGVMETNKYTNITGIELRDKFKNPRIGTKDGAHFLRAYLKTNEYGECLSRSDNNCQPEARLILIDVDTTTVSPHAVHEVLKQIDVSHIILGTHSYYADNLNRFRIIFISESAYSKQQLQSITEAAVAMVNFLLPSGYIEHAKENTSYSQPWYLPSMPKGCNRDILYLEYTQGELLSAPTKPLTSDFKQTTSNPIEKLQKDQLSAITAWNEQNPVGQVLQEHGYKLISSNEEYCKWLSPHSTSGNAGIIENKVSGKIFSFHNDVLNDGKTHDSFCTMRLLKRISFDEAVKFASLHTKAPNGQSIDQWNKAVYKEASEPVRDSWEDPIALIGSNEPTPYPVDALPQIIREAVKEVQGCLEAPFALVAHSALSWVAFSIQGRIVVKRDEQGTIPVYLNFFTVACSGERKTACDNLFGKSVKTHQAQIENAHNNKLKTYLLNFKKWDIKRDALEKKYKSSFNSKEDPKKQESILNELETHEMDKPASPKNWQIIYSDTTIEALLADLASNSQVSVILHSSEAGNFFGGHSMSSENAMKTIAQLNQLWDGETVSTNRKSGATHDGEKYGSSGGKAVCTSFQTQPKVFENLMATSKGLPRSMGLLARQLFSWPQSTIGNRPYKELSMMPFLTQYQQQLKNILSIPHQLNEYGRLAPREVSLTVEAKTDWINFHNEIEKQLGENGQYYEAQDIGSKTAENALRLAGILGYFENKDIQEISRKTMAQAIEITLFHLKEASRCYPIFSQSQEYANAILLDQWLINKFSGQSKNTISKRDIQQFGPNKIRNKLSMEKALDILKEHHRIRIIQNQSHCIEINPMLLRKST